MTVPPPWHLHHVEGISSVIDPLYLPPLPFSMSSDCDDRNGGISPAANHLYYWIHDPTNDGQVYCHDVVPYTVREVLVVLPEVKGIFDFEGGASASSHLSVRPGIQPEVAT